MDWLFGIRKKFPSLANNAQTQIVPPVRNSLFKRKTPPVNPGNYLNRLMQNQKEKGAKLEQNWNRRMQNMKNKSAKASMNWNRRMQNIKNKSAKATMNWNSFIKMTPEQRIAHQTIKRAENMERMKQQGEQRIKRMRNLKARKTLRNPFLPIATPNTVQTQTNILNQAIANSSKIRVSPPVTIFGSLNDSTNTANPAIAPTVTSFSLNDSTNTVNPVIAPTVTSFSLNDSTAQVKPALSGCGSSPIEINDMLESIEDGAKAKGISVTDFLKNVLNVPEEDAPRLYHAVEALESNPQSGGRKSRKNKNKKKNKSRRGRR